MRNRGKRWMAMTLAVIVTCVNLFVSGGNGLEVYAGSGTSEEFVINENGVLTGYNGPGGDVVIPDGVTSIDVRAFEGCVSVTSVVIPEGVTGIGCNAFEDCSGLTSVSIPESVKYIGEYAFSGCSGLTSIVVDEKNTYYDSRKNCNAIIGTSTNTLIAGCKNTIIPESVTSIEYGAFSGCSGLTSVSIPASVTSIRWDAFYGCSGLKSISVDKKNSCYDSRENCNAIIETITNTLIAGCKNTIIPGSVTSIEFGAFSGCSGLTSVSIPSSVTSIGYGAFSGCSGLTSVSISASVTSIGEYAFDSCSSLTSVSIPKSVTSIGNRAFRGCSSLTSVSIPESVTSIGYSAFSGCSGLTSIEIPESVTEISGSTFDGCSGLESISVDKKNTHYDSRENCNAIIGTSTNTLIAGCKNTIIPESVTEIGSSAFSGCSGLTSVSIPESVNRIWDSAFSGCSGLTSIEIPESVTEIGSSAFFNCSNLASVSIPKSINRISNGAFGGCSSLASVTIPESVKEIDDGAFFNCSSLVSIAIPKSVTMIDRGAFYGCSSLESLTIPEGVTLIIPSAFSGCSGLTSIIVDENNPYYDSRENCNAIIGTNRNSLIAGCKNTIIPESVTSIEYGAFNGCSGLISIIIPESVTSIGNNAFPEETILYVKAGSYGETYAKTNGYNYRTAFVCDAKENPVLTKEVVNDLIEKNSIIDIQILSNNNVQFTFAKGTMKAVEGLENYDFGTIVTTKWAAEGLPDSVTEEDFVAKISYNYSGQLPGEASIKIFVGEKYVGKRMEYSLLKEDNERGETQSAKVDSEGYITVKQSHCSTYVITLAKAMMGDTNNDGSVTAEDALAILKHVVGLEQLTGDALTSGDVNADSAITAEDALDVLKRVVGLISEFKAEAAN